MKVLVRRTRTQTYLSPQGEWVTNVDGALHFPGGAEAILYCQEKNIMPFEVILWTQAADLILYQYPSARREAA